MPKSTTTTTMPRKKAERKQAKGAVKRGNAEMRKMRKHTKAKGY